MHWCQAWLELAPDAGVLAPDAGVLAPDAGVLAPDAGVLAVQLDDLLAGGECLLLWTVGQIDDGQALAEAAR